MRARRHDDGTASAVAGHVAWVLLGMMGAWTEQLHALPARAPPAEVFAALREQTAAAEAQEAPLEGATRRASQARCDDAAWRKGKGRSRQERSPFLTRFFLLFLSAGAL